MKFGLTKATVDKIKGVFARFLAIEKAVLYGSRAKGNFKTGSDIDLTLYGESLTSDLHGKIAEALDDLLLPYTIDLSLFDELNNAKLRDHIERIGVVFYERINQGGTMKAGWEMKKLGEVCTIKPPKSEAKENLGNSDLVSFVPMESLGIGQKYFETSNERTLEKVAGSYTYFANGDVLLAKITPCFENGKLGIARNLKNGIGFGSSEYIVFRGIGALHNEFLYYFLSRETFREEGAKMMTGAVGHKRVPKEFIENTLIPIPPLPEQKRIVAILDEVFEAVATAKANAEKNLQNAREVFDSYLQSVFANPGEGWVKKTLKEMSLVFGRGKSKNRPRNDPKLYGGKYPFVQTGDIRNSDHFIKEYTQTYNEMGLAQSKLWPKGTLCITIAANIAETGILDFDACFPDSVIGFIAAPAKSDVNFVEYLLRSFKAMLQAKGKGSAQDNINMATFEQERFPFPVLQEQKCIVAKLDALSAETKKLEAIYQQKLTALEELKKSVLQKAFSGELV